MAAGREDVVKLLTKFINYNKETEGRRLDARPPFTGSSDAFSLEFWNSPEARRAELPSGGGLASARGLAVIAGHLARRGGDLLSRGAWEKMHQDSTLGFCFGMKCYFTQVTQMYFTKPDNSHDELQGWCGRFQGWTSL